MLGKMIQNNNNNSPLLLLMIIIKRCDIERKKSK